MTSLRAPTEWVQKTKRRRSPNRHWILMAAAVLPLIGCNAAASDRVIISNVTLSDPVMQDDRTSKTVVIEDGVIALISDAGSVDQRPDDHVIDGDGYFLAPGLVDSHIHHYDILPYSNFVGHGVTTVISLGNRGGSPGVIDFKAKVEDAKTFLPTLYAADNIIGLPDETMSHTELNAYVDTTQSRGFDLLKIYNGVSKDQFDLITTHAQALDLPIFGHLPRDIPTEYVLENGLDVVAHAEEFYFNFAGGVVDEALETIVEAERPDIGKIDDIVQKMADSDVALIPNLAFTFATMRFYDNEDRALSGPEMRFWPDGLIDFWRQKNSARREPIEERIVRERIKYNYILEFTVKAHRAGVLIMAGSDAPDRQMIPGESLHSELRELVKSGLSSREALAAATTNPGEFVNRWMKPDAPIGRILPGYQADLVLLRADPLLDIRHLELIEGVFVDGDWKTYDEIAAIRLRERDEVEAKLSGD